MSSIVQASAFDASKITVTVPKMLDSGSKQSYLNYGDSRGKLTLQTPSLPSPFGLNVFDKAGPPKYSVDLALRGYQEEPKVKTFFNALTALDNTMIELGVKNSKQWFGKEMKREIIEAFYTPTVKFGRDKEGNPSSYPPNINVKLKKDRKNPDAFECKFYDEKSRTDPRAPPLTGIPVEEILVKKTEVTALIECTGVWFAGGKFGVSWKGVQMRLDKRPDSINGYAIQDDDGAAPRATASSEFGGAVGASFRTPAPVAAAVEDEEEEDEDEELAPASTPAPQEAPVTSLEEEDEEEIAPVPVPKKTTVITKKKVVTKK